MKKSIKLLAKNTIAYIIDENEHFILLYKDGTIKYSSEANPMSVVTIKMDVESSIAAFTSHGLFSNVKISCQELKEDVVYTADNNDNVFIADVVLKKIVYAYTDKYFA